MPVTSMRTSKDFATPLATSRVFAKFERIAMLKWIFGILKWKDWEEVARESEGFKTKLLKPRGQETRIKKFCINMANKNRKSNSLQRFHITEEVH